MVRVVGLGMSDRGHFGSGRVFTVCTISFLVQQAVGALRCYCQSLPVSSRHASSLRCTANTGPVPPSCLAPPPSPCGCCASAQIPHLSGIEASLGALRLRGLLRTLRMLALGLHDLMRSKLGLSAAYVRIVGRPTDAALMLLEEAEEKGYYAKHPPVKRVGVCIVLLLLLEHAVLHCDRALASRVQFG